MDTPEKGGTKARVHVVNSRRGRVSRCQVCLVKYRKRTCFVKYAWGNAVFQKHAKREHALSSLSSMPGEVPFSKNKLRENREHALSSMPGEMPFCKIS